jgi:hypothetical protein
VLVNGEENTVKIIKNRGKEETKKAGKSQGSLQQNWNLT